MISLLSENDDLWQVLSRTNKPILIYGMGNGADKIFKICENKNIKISGVFASDEFVRGHSFRGFKVKKLSEIEQDFSDFIILVAFAVHDEFMLNKLLYLSKSYKLYAPEVPVVGEDIFDYDYLIKNLDEIKKVYNLLNDTLSKEVYISLINFKLSGKIQYLDKITTDKKEAFDCILKLGKGEIYFDIGAYNGDTIQEFIELSGDEFEKIIAFEPDTKNYEKLMKNNKLQEYNNITAYNIGAWHEKARLSFLAKTGRGSTISEAKGKFVDVVSIDQFFNISPVTYIKFDVEGSEFEAISGCKNTIQKYQPKMQVALYHRTEDFFKLPLFLHSICPEYKFSIRHFPYIPAWETNLFAFCD